MFRSFSAGTGRQILRGAREEKRASLLFKARVFSSFLVVAVLVTACGRGAEPGGGEGTLSSGERVTVDSMGQELEFTAVPQRAVSLDQNTTENMLALGLEEYMVGTAYMNDQILPEYKRAYEKVPVLAERYPSLEALLSVDPDFVYGQIYSFNEKRLATVESYTDKGIAAYVTKGNYVKGRPTMDDVYADFRNLGRIFRVESRAQNLIEQMKERIDQVQKRVGRQSEPVKVLVYDSGKNGLYTAGRSLETELIRLAGGENVFGDLDKDWAQVSWEEVVKRRPEVIVVNDYGKQSADEKIKEILDNSKLKGTPAVQNKRFVVIPLTGAFEGVRNADTVETLAKGFYPEKFEP
ncbi:ABC transporter substrate-binding protein [Desmospora profundinema]|uniref:Iron complex transport system substrate-binding protein n=1 Tax=Desmospora profundinema TaxID=1571184 RepID=A0ABU1IPH9_9BACL|nr:ABC transporter substrate-binding protein [Desmospora profundinema]MDR6226680.1 iron complex transport system substrate-binding protein [Desmospora profundinema]